MAGNSREIQILAGNDQDVKISEYIKFEWIRTVFVFGRKHQVPVFDHHLRVCELLTCGQNVLFINKGDMFMNSCQYGHVIYQIEALDEPDPNLLLQWSNFDQFRAKINIVM